MPARIEEELIRLDPVVPIGPGMSGLTPVARRRRNLLRRKKRRGTKLASARLALSRSI